MKNENNTQRQSSSTANNTTPHQSQDSDEPLDGASCSASSICGNVAHPIFGEMTRSSYELLKWSGDVALFLVLFILCFKNLLAIEKLKKYIP